ncbi:MAG: hypothetical protein J5779_02845 [Clostridia bacterium]|nr:hypothetical protein [Clostridia bacterium]
MLFLLSFIQDWWVKIQKFVHEINPTVKFVVAGVAFIVGLYALIKFFKPAGKGKVKLFPLIISILFIIVGILLLTL